MERESYVQGIPSEKEGASYREIVTERWKERAMCREFQVRERAHHTEK